MADIPVIEINIRIVSKQNVDDVCHALGNRSQLVPLHAAKKMTGSFLPCNKADGMDNSCDSINPSFCHGDIHRRWMIPPLPTCLVILLDFSLISFSHYCSPLQSVLANALSLFTPFLTSGHQINGCIGDCFMYSLLEMQAEPFMS